MPDDEQFIAAAPGRPAPLGCSRTPHGVNFAGFSRHAERVSLLLYSADFPATPRLVGDLDPDSELAFHLPTAYVHERWRLEIDTAADAVAAERGPPGEAGTWRLCSRSLKVLECMGEL